MLTLQLQFMAAASAGVAVGLLLSIGGYFLGWAMRSRYVRRDRRRPGRGRVVPVLMG